MGELGARTQFTQKNWVRMGELKIKHMPHPVHPSAPIFPLFFTQKIWVSMGELKIKHRPHPFHPSAPIFPFFHPNNWVWSVDHPIKKKVLLL